MAYSPALCWTLLSIDISADKRVYQEAYLNVLTELISVVNNAQ